MGKSGDYLFVVVDEYSSYPEVEIVKSTSATTVIPTLDKIFSSFGILHVVKTDNGPPFNGHSNQCMKQNADHHHRAQPSILKPGDIVLFRQLIKDKLMTPYKAKLYTIVRIKGSMVTASCSGHEVTRDSSHFKLLPSSVSVGPDSKVSDGLSITSVSRCSFHLNTTSTQQTPYYGESVQLPTPPTLIP